MIGLLLGALVARAALIGSPIAVSLPVEPEFAVGTAAAHVPEVAVIIDDLGYSRSAYSRLSKLPVSVTWSIFPSMPATRFYATTAQQEGRCAMVHLPLQNKAYKPPQVQRFLLISMSGPEVNELLREHLDTIPEAAGVNNHSGDLATENARLMTRVLTEIKKRGLFFVDSLTSPRSVCRTVANQLGVPFAARDVFLDDPHEGHARPRAIYIADQLQKAVSVARRKGWCIAIGHPHHTTLDVLAREMPRLESEGVRFVPASQIVRDESAFAALPASSPVAVQ